MNKCVKNILVIALSIVLCHSAFAGINDLPVKTVNGCNYHYYEVQPQETMYSLCKRFGLTQEEIKRYNPSVEDGLKAYQILLFPVNETAKSSASTSSYEVQKGDTGYGISRKFDMSLDEFYALNPSARDGLKSGLKVIVRSNGSKAAESLPVATQKEKTHTAAPTTVKTATVSNNVGAIYTVKAGDTFYSIAREHGLDPKQLIAANSDVDMLQPGMQLKLPQSCAEVTVQTHVEAFDPQNEVSVSSPTESDMLSSSQTIALVLPLQAGQSQRSRQAQYYADFVRGFMLAVDSIGDKLNKAKVIIIDTKGSNAGISAALADSRLSEAGVIITTDDGGRLKEFASVAKKSGAMVLNLFSMKNQSYLTNPNVMQANIPHGAMYDKAIDYYISSYPEVVPVILKRTGGATDKQEFVDKLKAKLTTAGRQYHEITFSETLTSDDLSKLNAKNKYAFIPVTSNTDELDKYIHAISSYKETRSEADGVSLWGYAEWLKLRGARADKLHDLNTVLFSRFYSGTDELDDARLKSSFDRWYGQPMMEGVPSQATFGFDTAMYLLRALSRNGGDFDHYTPQYLGIQNTYDFHRVEGGGFLNDKMYMIKYSPSGATFKTGI